MPLEFATDAVSATCEEWGHLVLLGSIEAMDGKPYLMLQVAHEFNADDVRLGQDRPYIEINNQGWSWYGQIVKFELHRSRVVVQMDQKAQERMDNDGLFTFTFLASEEVFRELGTAIARIFYGCTCYRPHAA